MRSGLVVTHDRSVSLFTPYGPEATSFLHDEVAQEPWQWLGPSLVVEWRYTEPLVKAAREHGIDVEKERA